MHKQVVPNEYFAYAKFGLMTAADYISHLHLDPHPEGGFYKETYRSGEAIAPAALPLRFSQKRYFSTAIYYLLQAGDFSAFHRIKSDECWHFYAGDTLLIHVIDENGHYSVGKLGAHPEKGEVFQFVVPATAWFAAELTAGSLFVLAGCTVSPGFDFADFEMADKLSLLLSYPAYAGLINRLCK